MRITLDVIYASDFNNAVCLKIKIKGDSLENTETLVQALADSLSNVNPDNIRVLPEESGFGSKTFIIWNFPSERESVMPTIIDHVGQKAMDHIDHTVQKARNPVTQRRKVF